MTEIDYAKARKQALDKIASMTADEIEASFDKILNEEAEWQREVWEGAQKDKDMYLGTMTNIWDSYCALSDRGVF